jgi:dimethylargininase
MPRPPIALTREVSCAIVACELTHLARVPIDVDVARAEHAAYERALADAGCEVRRVAAADDLPDAVFVEDTAVVLDELAVLARPGAASRHAELPAVAEALGALRPLAAIAPPGTLDGGDVLRVGRRLYVGVGGRTNAAGAAQLRALVVPHGYTVREVAPRGCLHLKTAVTAVADDLLLVNPAWVDPSVFDGMRTLAVAPAEPFAANALRVGGTVLHGAHFPATRRRLVAAGIAVVPVPAAELAKAEGGVTCGCLLVSR